MAEGKIQFHPSVRLLYVLEKFGICEVTQKKHSFSMASMMISGTVPKIDERWFPLAVVSLSREFIEFVPAVKERRR